MLADNVWARFKQVWLVRFLKCRPQQANKLKSFYTAPLTLWWFRRVTKLLLLLLLSGGRLALKQRKKSRQAMKA